MKKLAFIIAAMLVSLASHAQFEQGKVYCGASYSGFDFSSNNIRNTHVGIGAKGGYLIIDNLTLLAEFDYDYYRHDFDIFTASTGARYHITQNGIFLGATASMMVFEKTDIGPSVQVGYTFFLNKTITIEPELYYYQSLANHHDFSTIGFRIGIGLYLDNLFKK
ncbi:MAG: outer membrane beta-barrel protein [Prevotella sp.]|nr:outer membrane beta-barrel protein [Prevotella sp.]